MYLQALQLVSDVHMLADQVLLKVGVKSPKREASGALTPGTPLLGNDEVMQQLKLSS